MSFAKRLTKDAGLLLVLLLLFALLRFPSLFEPYWYGDEGIYFIVGKALHAGRELYSTIWDNKPPLLYWFYYFFNDLFSIRLASLIFGLTSVLAFFSLTEKLFTIARARYLSVVLFVFLFALPSIEGNIANAENFMLLPIITGAYLLWLALVGNTSHSFLHQHSSNRILLLLAGILLGTAFLFKTVALFDFAAFGFFAVMLSFHSSQKTIHWKSRILSFLPFPLGFILPITAVSVIFLLKGILPEFLETIFLVNTSYVGEKNALYIPQGLILLKLLLLGGSLFGIYRVRTFLSKPALFILIWLAFSVFNAFFSQRPYTHYQLVALPSFALAAGLLFAVTGMKQRLFLGLLLASIAVIFYNHFPHWNGKKTVAYYRNFHAYMMGTKSVTEYQTFFDRNTPRDYALADYLRLHTKPNEEVFLWGDSAQVYYLSRTLPAGRFAVSYHINTEQTIRETQDVIDTARPKFVLLFPRAEPFPLSIPHYAYKFTIVDTALYERIN